MGADKSLKDETRETLRSEVLASLDLWSGGPRGLSVGKRMQGGGCELLRTSYHCIATRSCFDTPHSAGTTSRSPAAAPCRCIPFILGKEPNTSTRDTAVAITPSRPRLLCLGSLHGINRTHKDANVSSFGCLEPSLTVCTSRRLVEFITHHHFSLTLSIVILVINGVWNSRPFRP